MQHPYSDGDAYRYTYCRADGYANISTDGCAKCNDDSGAFGGTDGLAERSANLSAYSCAYR